MKNYTKRNICVSITHQCWVEGRREGRRKGGIQSRVSIGLPPISCRKNRNTKHFVIELLCRNVNGFKLLHFLPFHTGDIVGEVVGYVSSSSMDGQNEKISV